MLEENPETRRAILAEMDADNVIVTIALRHVATCEMRIAKGKYDPFLLMGLIKRHGQAMH